MGGKALQKTSGSRRKNAKLNDELYDVKVEASAKRYQVWAHFKALNKAVLVASLKTLEFFLFQELMRRNG